jgi:hypothetical protein
MILYRNKVHMSKYKGLWVVSIKQNMSFNFQPLSTLVFLRFKNGLLEGLHPLKIYEHTRRHGDTLSSARFAPTSEIWTSAFI